MRFRRFVKREYLNRSLPHGLVSPRYLFPFQPEPVRLHRHLWLRSMPRMPLGVFLPLEGFLYLRWVFFSSWRFACRAVKHRGPGIREREGVGLLRQFLGVLSLSLLYTIPPSEIHAFGLHRPELRKRVWDYVFTHELPAFHRWRDRRHGRSGQSGAILADKKKTAEILSRQDLPVVPTLATVSSSDPTDLSAWLASHPRLFFKPRFGSAARGCFVAERAENKNGFTVCETRAGMAMERTATENLFEALGREPYLVQPLMPNHPDLAGLCETRDAITVRIITEAPDKKPVRCYAAMLEIPGPATDPVSKKRVQGNERFHLILPIDPVRGRTLPWEAGALPQTIEARYGTWYEKAENREVPFWNRMREIAVTAHGLFRDVYAIAWDYVVTVDGPFLLEGNTGWGTRLPQMVQGGLVRGSLGGNYPTRSTPVTQARRNEILALLI